MRRPDVLFSGSISEFPGLWQINARVPDGVSSQVPLFLIAKSEPCQGPLEEFRNHLPAELAELAEAAGVKIGEARIVEAEQVEDGHVNVAHGMHHLDGFLADLISRADHAAGADAAASEPHGHGIGIMVAPPGGIATADAVVG